MRLGVTPLSGFGAHRDYSITECQSSGYYSGDRWMRTHRFGSQRAFAFGLGQFGVCADVVSSCSLVC